MEIQQKTIPKGWVKTDLFDNVFFDVIKSRIKKFSGEKKYLSTSSIDNDRIVSIEAMVSFDSRPSRANMLPVNHSVWFAKMKSTTKVIIANQDMENDTILSTGFFGIIPKKDKVLSLYLKQIFLSDYFNNLKDANSTGSTMQGISNDGIKKIDILLPLLGEQKKIADVLSAVDDEIQKTEKIIAQTENLKNGVSQHLFTRGIGHDKFQKTKVGDIPKEWSFLKMKDICTVSQGLQIPISSRFKDPGENRYKYITLKNIKEDAYEYIESPKESVICKKDDVLMTRTGNTGVVVTDVEGVFHNNFFLIDFDRKRIDRNYLVYYLRSEPIKKLLLERAGTTTIPDLNHGAFYGIHFLLPSITEQKKISDILSSIDNKIIFNKEVREKLTKLKKGLMQDLLSGRVKIKPNS